MNARKKVVVSDAAPLIQLALAYNLELLPELYDVCVPTEVYNETQHYPELPDAMEIALAAGTWLQVKEVKNKKRVDRLLQQKLGKGEAEAIVLCQEIRADSILTSDRFAALRAVDIGVKTITIGDVIKDAFTSNVLTKTEIIDVLQTLIGQNILNTSYLKQLLQEASTWP